jgi:hypothetical protein
MRVANIYLKCDLHTMWTRAGHVCPSVFMIQLENRQTNSDEIWFEPYAISAYPKTEKLRHLQYERTILYGYWVSENTRHRHSNSLRSVK